MCGSHYDRCLVNCVGLYAVQWWEYMW